MCKPAGYNLRLLWGLTSGYALTSEYAASDEAFRPIQSGREIIHNAAAAIRRFAISRPNPVAEVNGFRPCLIVSRHCKSRSKRPMHQFAAQIDTNGINRKFYAFAYHVVWCDENNKPPPAKIGLVYSHLCHERCCVEPQHGIWETMAMNTSRDDCRNGAICKHRPACLI
jgi:hypothetical protein